MSGQVAESAQTEVKRSAGFLIAMGVLLVVLGFLAVGAPLQTGIAVAILVGAMVLVQGIMQLVYAFRAKSWGAGILVFVLGGLSIVAGVLVLAHPLMGLGFLTLLLAAYFVVEGVFEIIHAFELKPLKGWGWTLFTGIVTLLLGVMIWRQWPLSGAWAVGVLAGVSILFNGWSMVMLSLSARKLSTEEAEALPSEVRQLLVQSRDAVWKAFIETQEKVHSSLR